MQKTPLTHVIKSVERESFVLVCYFRESPELTDYSVIRLVEDLNTLCLIKGLFLMLEWYSSTASCKVPGGKMNSPFKQKSTFDKGSKTILKSSDMLSSLTHHDPNLYCYVTLSILGEIKKEFPFTVSIHFQAENWSEGKQSIN